MLYRMKEVFVMFNSAFVMNNAVRFMYYYMGLICVVHRKGCCI